MKKKFFLYIGLYVATFCIASFSLWYDLSFGQVFLKAVILHLVIWAGISGIFALLFVLTNAKKTFLIINIFLLLYWLINSSYFDYAKSYLTFRIMYSMAVEGLQAVHHGYNPFKFSKIIYFLPLISAFLLVFYRNIFQTQRVLAKKTVLLLGLLTIPSIFLIMNYRQGAIKSFYSADDSRCVYVYRYGILTYQVLHLVLSNEKTYIDSLNKKMGPLQIQTTITPNQSPNIVVIQIETLNASVLNYNFQGHWPTPYLNELAKNNVYFPYLLSYHFASRSADADFSVLNAMEPLANYPVISLGDYKYPNSIVAQLNQAGYITKAFHNNTGMFMYRLMNFAHIGFSQFHDLKDLGIPIKGWGGTDGDLFEKMAGFIKDEKSPFFYFTITLTSHTPFDFFKEVPYDTPDFDKVSDEKTKNYFKSISYLDQNLAQYIEEAKKIPNTYIFIYGDHSTGGEVTTNIMPASYVINNNTMLEFVPLIIITPDGKKYTETENAVMFPDISRTILDLTGKKYEIKTYGQNLFKSLENSQIPFQNHMYSRKELFKLIDEKIKK